MVIHTMNLHSRRVTRHAPSGSISAASAGRAGPYTIRLEEKLSGRQLEKLLALPDGRTGFRFFGVLPEPGKRFVLRDVRVRGTLEERDGR